MGEKSKAEPASNVVNSLRALRMAKGLSQGQLADGALVTRQAVCAIEANQYLPTTAVALRLASVLGCHVEDIFSLKTTGELIEGDWVRHGTAVLTIQPRSRVKVAKVEDRFIVRPVAALGEVLNYTVPADGLVIGRSGGGTRSSKIDQRVRVRLLRERQLIEQEIAVAGCDPAINLASEYLRRHKDASTVVGWTMGSAAALDALKRKEVHMAGLHILDAKTGESNLPYLRRHLQGDDYIVVTFAAWEEGLIVGAGNPKRIRTVDDLARPDVLLVNREEGAGARMLLDQRLSALGIKGSALKGYNSFVSSHFEVARHIAERQADVGIGIRSAAQIFGLDFIPLQQARYDLVFPKRYLAGHPGLSHLLDAIASRQFRTEVEALGGYDMTETGKVRNLRAG
ncbi:MAG: Transcriptional regulator of molybdate metabolism, Xre family [Nitrospira sp.]|jgi:molybdate-binding protein/DNA-binding XRE family transcriptional regulator|nr:Transcriptional regulator of molybdate metabolism, Xre family [Nitrospira sp.]